MGGGDLYQVFYLMDISLFYCAQPLQQLLPDQDFWMTAFGRLPLLTLLRFASHGSIDRQSTLRSTYLL